MDELNALRYCVSIIEERCKASKRKAWLWRLRKKVAQHFLRVLEERNAPPSTFRTTMGEWAWSVFGVHSTRTAPDTLIPANLTDEEKKIVLLTHPLLQQLRQAERRSAVNLIREQQRDVRVKVAALYKGVVRKG